MSTESAARIASVPRSGELFKAILSTPATPRMFILPDFGRDSDLSPAATDFNIIGPATPSRAPPGCSPWAPVFARTLSSIGLSSSIDLGAHSRSTLGLFSALLARLDSARGGLGDAGQLDAEHFAAYPPRAKNGNRPFAICLRQLPASFLPFLLKETFAFDCKFPAERDDLLAQLSYLEALPSVDRYRAMAAVYAASSYTRTWST